MSEPRQKDQQPYYEIDTETKTIILGLAAAATELKLENVSFAYHGLRPVRFYLERANGWEVAVFQDQPGPVTRETGKQWDIYKIDNGAILYQYSEHD